MKPQVLRELEAFIGSYAGIGVNHEKQSFVGRMRIEPMLGGKGYRLEFSATSEMEPSQSYHVETSTIAPSPSSGISLFNFNSNTPFLAEHALASVERYADRDEFVFRFGDFAASSAFREEIKLALMKDGAVGYHYSWGLPGGEFAPRSGVTMKRSS